MTVVPWDHPKPAEPHAPGAVENVPSLEGVFLGVELARLADRAEREYLAAKPDRSPRCHDCAFLLGTKPNQMAPTLMSAIKCVAEGTPFLCHLEGEPICAGWAAAMSQKREARA